MLSLSLWVTITITSMNPSSRTRRVEKLTIKQVAEAAGVSVMTVSRVLNNRPDVSSATRKRIQQIIDELGYAPNAMASSLRQGRSNTLGIVATGIEYFGPSRTIV